MTPLEIKKKALSFGPWEPWIERPFGAFVLSFSKTGSHPHSFKKFGIDAGFNASIFSEKQWYRSPNWDNKLQNKISSYIKSGGSIFDISGQCERFYRRSKKDILEINSDKSLNPDTKLKKLFKIYSTAMDYVWITHSFESVYIRLFRQVGKKYINGDVEKFIHDASFPVKKNAHTLMMQELAAGGDLRKIAKKFGWIKSRFKFIPGYTPAEMRKMGAEASQSILQEEPAPALKISPKLQKLVNEFRELVYFRTYRTDVLYELLYRSHPSLKEIARFYKIKFADLENYSIDDLIAGKPKFYPFAVSAAFYGGEIAIFTKPLFQHKTKLKDSVTGNVAYAGFASGRAKIVRSVLDLNKVKAGDILIAPTTVPSYLPAMHRAGAFVTDEGGLTCHAAIVARELKKPCVIGTKIATQVFKDGDLLEVDAERGSVKKI